MKRPAFQFYPADWRKDAALQSCSLAAQGLWVNIMCIAHECEPYGHLVINGKPMTAAQIARLVGISAKECEQLIAEIIDAGVASRNDDGAIYSRRMVRDEEIRNKRAEGGKAGSEYGHLGAEHGAKGGRPANGRGVSKPPLEPPPSSSSSSSSSTSKAEIQSSSVHPPVDDDDSLGHPLAIAGQIDPLTLRAIELVGLLRPRGAKLQASDPKVRGWAEAGITDAQALAALERAQQHRADAGDPSPVNAGYLESILKTSAAPGRRANGKPSVADQNAAAFADAKRMIFGGVTP